MQFPEILKCFLNRKPQLVKKFFHKIVIHTGASPWADCNTGRSVSHPGGSMHWIDCTTERFKKHSSKVDLLGCCLKTTGSDNLD